VLEAFITLVGPRLLLKPAEKALEWLVRRFRYVTPMARRKGC
jgi:U3 small nucleolar RNA-associated protein 10